MDEAVIHAVKQSYGRALGNPRLMADFYDTLMASHPGIAKMFANTDLQKQQLILKQSLSMAILFPQDNLIAKHAMEKVRKTHAHDQLNIRPELYDYWLNSLLSVVKNSDPDFSPELEGQWRMILNHTLSYIKEGY